MASPVLANNGKVAPLHHLGEDFDGFEAGTLREDAKVGLGHPAAWEHIALATDVDRVRVAAKAFGFAMPGEVRVFGNADMEAARDWLSA